MVARDQGSPAQSGTATITVNVERNRYNPEFSRSQPYEITVADTYTPSVTILTVTATDRDSRVNMPFYRYDCECAKPVSS